MTLFEKAFEFAKKAHEGQVDKAGNPYINHPLWVGSHCNGERAQVVGLLHDTVEDTSTTLEDIEREFGHDIRDGVDGMTKREDEDYLSFVKRAMQNPLSKEAKKMDIRHNMDLSRSNSKPGYSDFERMEKKYIPGYKLLTGHNLLLTEQMNTSLSEDELKALIYEEYSKMSEDSRVKKNMEYICSGFSNAVSDELRDYLLEVLNK